MMRTPEQISEIAKMRQQVFSKHMTFDEFAFQVSLIDGETKDRADWDRQTQEACKQERAAMKKVSHLM